jgi:LPXTG-motif cell wall-anchored protein
MRDGVDVTENYANLIADEGTLTVEKVSASITVTAGSASKDYDGTPLTEGTYTFTEGVLIEGDELVIVIEGSQTEVGSSANKVVSIKVMRGDTDVTDCYTIEAPVDGELVIIAVPETGDNTNVSIWSVLMLTSLLTLLVLAFTSRRKQTAR